MFAKPGLKEECHISSAVFGSKSQIVIAVCIMLQRKVCDFLIMYLCFYQIFRSLIFQHLGMKQLVKSIVVACWITAAIFH